MQDNYKNFVVGSVVQAPNPSTSGTKLKLRPGEGGLVPEPPFKAFIKPKLVQARLGNTEIVRVTDVDGDELTIERQQEGTSAQPIGLGWDFYVDQTAGQLTEMVQAIEQGRDRHYEQEFTNKNQLVVTHNLGKKPAVTVLDSAGDQVIGDVKYSGDNQLTVSFSASFSGIVICN